MNQRDGKEQQFRVNHLRVGWVLFKRDFIGSLLSPAIYIAVTVACLISTFFVVNYLNTLNKVSVLVSVDPLSAPLFFAIALIALYIGVISSISITGEREHRTLEVLFYGPVTPWSLVLAKFSYGIAIFLFALAFFTLYLLVESTITNLALGPRSLKSIGISFFLVWPMVSFSLLLSAILKRVRNAVLLFIGIFLVLTGLQIAYGLLLSIPSESISLFLLYVREGLAILLKGLQWVSPFSYIAKATTDMSLNSPLSIGWSILFAFFYSSFLLILAIFVFKKRGVVYG
jgi:ABC-type transport system involved in multi-copper enzyme maturation permease subunit